jgi:hypothetical protein
MTNHAWRELADLHCVVQKLNEEMGNRVDPGHPYAPILEVRTIGPCLGTYVDFLGFTV